MRLSEIEIIELLSKSNALTVLLSLNHSENITYFQDLM